MLVMPAGLLLLLGQLKPIQHASADSSAPPTPAALLFLPPPDLLRPEPPLLRPAAAAAAGLPRGGSVMSPVGDVSRRRSHSFTTPSMSLLLIMVCSLRTNSSDVTLRRQLLEPAALLPLLGLPCLLALPGVPAAAAAVGPPCWRAGAVAMSMRMIGPSCMRRLAADHLLGVRRSHSKMPPSREPGVVETACSGGIRKSSEIQYWVQQQLVRLA
jgi:hypothetical protein